MKESTKVKLAIWCTLITGIYIIFGFVWFFAQFYLYNFSEPTVYVHWAEPTVVRTLSSNKHGQLALYFRILSWFDDEPPHPGFIKDIGTNITFDSCAEARDAVETMKNEYHWTVLEPRKGRIYAGHVPSNDWRKKFVGHEYHMDDDTYKYTHNCDECTSIILECDPGCRQIRVTHPCNKPPANAVRTYPIRFELNEFNELIN